MANVNPVVFFDLALGGKCVLISYFSFLHAFQALLFHGLHPISIAARDTLLVTSERLPVQVHLICSSPRNHRGALGPGKNGTLRRLDAQNGRKLPAILHGRNEKCPRLSAGIQRQQVPSSREFGKLRPFRTARSSPAPCFPGNLHQT